MTKPYGLMADIHAHDWSQFSSTGPDGINTRLTIILDEFDRAFEELHKAGGDTMVIAGDFFHQRGVIRPEVFNPVYERAALRLKAGFRIIGVPGNHDLATKETTEIGNAFQSLGELNGFDVITRPMTYTVRGHKLALVPWVSSIKELKAVLEALPVEDRGEYDLILHAGIDGVLSGVPAHGLTPAYLAGLGFKRVFAGHYHHHCEFEGGAVYSIGATTHQTFSDIGTRAGFLLRHPDRVEFRASHAPDFVEITGDTDPDEVPLIVEGNYVRARGMKLTDREISELRKQLLELGARGVSFNVEKVSTSVREGDAIASPTTTLEMSVDAYVEKLAPDHLARVKEGCANILRDVRAEAA